MKPKGIDPHKLDRARLLIYLSEGVEKDRILRELFRDASAGDGGQAFFELLVAASEKGPRVVGNKLKELLEIAFRVVLDESRSGLERAEAMSVLARFHLLRPLPALEIASVAGRAFLLATELVQDVGKRLRRDSAALLMEWDMTCLLEGAAVVDDLFLRRNARPDYRYLTPACEAWLKVLRDERADELEQTTAGVMLLSSRWPRLEMGLHLEPHVSDLAEMLKEKHEALYEMWLRVKLRIQRRREALRDAENIGEIKELLDAKSLVDNPGRLSRGRIRQSILSADSVGYSHPVIKSDIYVNQPLSTSFGCEES